MEKEVLVKHTNLIEDSRIKEFVVECLELAPNYFWRIAASSSGKYHPELAQGKGGLVRHTIKALEYGVSLCEKNSIVGVEKDKVIAALILHDTCKAGTKEEENHTHFPYHAYQPKHHFKKPAEKIPEIAGEIFRLVDTHMGQWSTFESKIPKMKLEKITHFADYLASRKNQPIEDYKEELGELKTYDESIVL